MTRYVQHKSGVGEKWEVHSETDRKWIVGANPIVYQDECALPKSEYHEVPPPEVWVDVTKDCNIQFNGEIWHDCKNVTFYSSHIDQQEKDRIYRLRKVMLWRMIAKTNSYDPVDAFIVEKRTP